MTANSPSTAAWTEFAIPAWWSPALARPAHFARYRDPDAADRAAANAYGIAKNHGFLDGNKRTAWVTARLFLADNGRRLEFDPADAIRTMEGVASGHVSETALADWFRSHMTLHMCQD